MLSMIGEGVYTPSPPAAAAPPQLDYCNSTSSSGVVALCCSSFKTATAGGSAPAPPAAPPAASEPRRLAKAPHPTHILKCPRCASADTKFCYYNNYSLSQPRYFCKTCKRYWTAGGVLRNVPVGGGLRKNKRCKLRLAAEAEAAAAAAALESQQQHYEGQPASPVQVASACALGSSATSADSSVVSGVPALNYVGAVLPAGYLPSHDPTAYTGHQLLRTSSGSECSTIDNAGNESRRPAAAFLMEQQQSCAHGGRPQFYTSTSLGSSQYSGTSGEEGARSSYHGYGGCTQPPASRKSSSEQVMGSNRNGLSLSAAIVHKGSEGGPDVSGYNDWQFLSESLFNGPGGTEEGFLPLPGGSWPDFSQFNDPTGPG